MALQVHVEGAGEHIRGAEVGGSSPPAAAPITTANPPPQCRPTAWDTESRACSSGDSRMSRPHGHV